MGLSHLIIWFFFTCSVRTVYVFGLLQDVVIGKVGESTDRGSECAAHQSKVMGRSTMRPQIPHARKY